MRPSGSWMHCRVIAVSMRARDRSVAYPKGIFYDGNEDWCIANQYAAERSQYQSEHFAGRRGSEDKRKTLTRLELSLLAG